MNSRWKSRAVALLLACLLMCVPLAVPAGSPVLAAENSVSLAISSLTLSVGSSYDCMVTAPLTGDLNIQVSNDCAVLADGGKLTVEENGRSFRLTGQRVGSCTVTVTAVDGGSVTLPVTVQASSGWKSDTTSDLTVQPGATYQFKLTADHPEQLQMWAGTPDVFTVKKVLVENNAVYYKITAVGTPGSQAGLYVSYAGSSGTKLCVATVAGSASGSGSTSGQTSGSGSQTPAVSLRCDTTSDFGLAKGASYQFRLTVTGGGKPSFWAGTPGIFEVKASGQSGDDYFYKITAIGESGQSAGFYAAVEGQSGVKQCVVTVAYG